VQEKHGREAEGYLREGIAGLDLDLTDHQLLQLVFYCLELQKWNSKINLVAKNTSPRDMMDKHFLDSLTVLPVLRRFNCLPGTLLDVGSGAGFPGLVLKIACPSLATVLLEPRQRRAAFLSHIARLLGLERIEVLIGRTDDRELLSGYKFSVITGRAVADVAGFLAMIGHLATPRTLIICMQGEGGRDAWRKNGTSDEFKCLGIEETVIPLSRARRYLLLFQKTASVS